MCVIDRDGNVVIIDRATRIAELEAQVAALREIAIEERAKYEALSGWYVDGWEELDEEDDSALVEKNIHGKRFFRDEARRQLAEEHPGAFR